MDVYDHDRGHGHAPAGGLSAAEESAAAASCSPAAPRLLCAQCVGILVHPIGRVTADGANMRMGDPSFTLAEAVAAADLGQLLVHDLEGPLPLRAVTTVRGSASCERHLYVVANEGGRGFPFRV